jgi:hypothetical protein
MFSQTPSSLSSYVLCSLFLALVAILFGCRGHNVHGALKANDRNALMAALDAGANPNEINDQGLSPLHVSVAQQDVEATALLLERGARFDIPSRHGQTALRAALNGGISASRESNPDDPRVRVLRAVMRAKRMQSRAEVDVNGKLGVTFVMGGLGAGGFELFPTVTLEVPGRVYRIELSRLETEYIGLTKAGTNSEWNLVLQPQGVYRVRGSEKAGDIEATYIELIRPPGAKNQMVYPMRNWLPTTWEAMFPSKSR